MDSKRNSPKKSPTKKDLKKRKLHRKGGGSYDLERAQGQYDLERLQGQHGWTDLNDGIFSIDLSLFRQTSVEPPGSEFVASAPPGGDRIKRDDCHEPISFNCDSSEELKDIDHIDRSAVKKGVSDGENSHVDEREVLNTTVAPPNVADRTIGSQSTGGKADCPQVVNSPSATPIADAAAEAEPAAATAPHAAGWTNESESTSGQPDCSNDQFEVVEPEADDLKQTTDRDELRTPKILVDERENDSLGTCVKESDHAGVGGIDNEGFECPATDGMRDAEEDINKPTQAEEAEDKPTGAATDCFSQKPLWICKLMIKWPVLVFLILLGVHTSFYIATAALYFADHNIFPDDFQTMPVTLHHDSARLRELAWKRRGRSPPEPVNRFVVDIFKDQPAWIRGFLKETVELFYESESGNVLTRADLFMIKDIEDTLFSLKRYAKGFCQRERYGSCIKPFSILRFFDGTYGHINPIFKDENFTNIAQVLKMAKQHEKIKKALEGHLAIDSVIEDNTTISALTRSFIFFGWPLESLASNGNMTGEINNYLKTEFKQTIKMLQEKYKDRIGFYFYHEKLYFDDVRSQAMQDLNLAYGSLLFILGFILLHTRSFWISFWAIYSMGGCFFATNIIYRYVIGFQYFGFLHILSVFIILGVGADDIFIFYDTWRATGHAKYPSLVHRFSHCYRRSAGAMFATSLTTMVAFFISGISPLLMVQTFGIFTGFLVLTNYISVITFFPSVIIVYRLKIRPCFTRLYTDLHASNHVGDGKKHEKSTCNKTFCHDKSRSYDNSAICCDESLGCCDDDQRGAAELKIPTITEDEEDKSVKSMGVASAHAGIDNRGFESDASCISVNNVNAFVQKSSENVSTAAENSPDVKRGSFCPKFSGSEDSGIVDCSDTTESFDSNSCPETSVTADAGGTTTQKDILCQKSQVNGNIGNCEQPKDCATLSKPKKNSMEKNQDYYSSCCCHWKRRKHFLIQFFEGPFCWMISHRIIRWILLVGFAAMVATFAYFCTKIVPDDEEIQAYKPESNYGKSTRMRLYSFKTTERDEMLKIYMIWGLKEQNVTECDYWNIRDVKHCSGKTVFDKKFDINVPGGQRAMMRFCDKLDNLPLKRMEELMISEIHCFMHDMEKYFKNVSKTLTQQVKRVNPNLSMNLTIPFNEEKMTKLMKLHPAVYDPSLLPDNFTNWFEIGLGYWMSNMMTLRKTDDYMIYNPLLGEVKTPTTQQTRGIDIFYGTKMQYAAVVVKTSVSARALGFRTGLPLFEKWEELLTELRSDLPDGLNDPFLATPELNIYLWLKVQQTLSNQAIMGVGLGIAFAFPVLIFATQNVIVGILATISISLSTICVVGIIPIAGWKLGVLESVNLCLVVGLSIDYEVHLAEGYYYSLKKCRKDRVRQLLGEVGISVFSGAMTTLGASIFMLFAELQFYVQFGSFMFCTIGFSILFGLGWFTTALALFGPQEDCGSLLPMWKKIKSCCSFHRRKKWN